MNEFFQENRKALFGFIILLFLLLIALYFALLRPLTSDLKRTERAMETLEEDIHRLKIAMENEEEEKTAWNLESLRKKVPADKELDPLLLTLDEIEAVSNSRIENIDFTYEADLPEGALAEEESEEQVDEEVGDEEIEEVDEGEEGEDTDEEIAEEEADEAEEEKERERVIFSEIPEELHTISVSMTVYSPDYEHFRRFLVEMYRSERILLVESLSFEKPAETELLMNPEEETISFTIDFLTFYHD